MTLSQIETLVWSWLDDPLGGYFTKAQIDVWINNAQKEVQKRLLKAGENYYVEKMSGLTIYGQDTYTLPSDFKSCHKFEIVTSGLGTVNEHRVTLTPVTYNQLDAYPSGPALPLVYNFRRNLVTIRPMPDQAYTMYLHQSYRVTDLVNPNDLPDVPEDYTELIAVLATLDGFMKDQRDASQFVLDKKAEYEKMMNQDAKLRTVSAPRRIVETEGFATDGAWIF